MTTLGNWQFIHASVIGTAHLGEGGECQDACAVRLLERPDAEPALLLAVADGAGSAERSREGAELSCRTLLDAFADALHDGSEDWWQQINIHDVLEQVRAALAQCADEMDLPFTAFSCTLLGAVLAGDRALLLQIGDGAIVLGSEQNHYHVQFWPHTGRYPNETWFITDPDAQKRLDVAIVSSPITEIALLTDGLQWLALHYEQRQAYAPFFRPLFRQLRACHEQHSSALLEAALHDFLAGADVNARTNDDKTLVLATRIVAEQEPETGAGCSEEESR